MNAPPSVDAERIALCDRLMAIQAEQDAIFDALAAANTDSTGSPAIAALNDEIRIIIHRLYKLGDASTLAGLRAMSRAARALAPKRLDGSLFISGDAEWLAFQVTLALVQGDPS